MSALAEALTAAQAKAISALEKAYVAGHIEPERLSARLTEIGATDTVDGALLLAALDVLREYGSSAPTETKANGDGPATNAQRAYLGKLLTDGGFDAEPPGWASLTKGQASQMIKDVKAGTYKDVPF